MRHLGKLGGLFKKFAKQLKQKARFKTKSGRTGGKVEQQIAKPTGAQVPTDAGKRRALLSNKRSRPEPDEWVSYKTHSIQQSPMQSEQGRKLVKSYEHTGLSKAQAIRRADELIRSGSTLPEAVALKKGDKLYKLVPEGEYPGEYSPYFATKSEIKSFEQARYDEITDKIGIPLESQQTNRFEVFEVEAKRDVEVFESIIAPTTQKGYSQPGGGMQTLITDRSEFSNPKSTNWKLP
ncbi:hypothetical protein [Agarivorans gilvus]|uniref:Uncharacterized protein n=1 Tax=Agarivorans gilvus TaxID=680279 RepID=A0ABQ1I947_9ALTE|nr:hypothetical protein [Agarivorans gilvus]GGB22386.1 hypothetical protein GCM10007414_39660 [Agarivorans gilvus]